MHVAEFLKASGKSLRVFAKEIRISKSAMGRLAARERVPSTEVAERIIAATGGAVRLRDLRRKRARGGKRSDQQ